MVLPGGGRQKAFGLCSVLQRLQTDADTAAQPLPRGRDGGGAAVRAPTLHVEPEARCANQKRRMVKDGIGVPSVHHVGVAERHRVRGSGQLQHAREGAGVLRVDTRREDDAEGYREEERKTHGHLMRGVCS